MIPVSSNLTPALTAGVPLADGQAIAARSGKRATSAGKGAAADSIASSSAASKAAASGKSTKASTAKKTTTSAAKKTTTTSKAGYASTTSLPKDLAFLRDPKLNVEEKLMRLAAYLSEKGDAEIQKKMEELTGGATGKASSKEGTTTKAATKPKKKGFWSKALDSVKVMFPAVGLSMQLLKTPATKAALKQIGGPVLAAAATALGFPQAAPALLKYGPQAVDLAAGALQAVEKAATAEEKAAAEPSASSSASGASAGASGTGSPKNEQLQMMELTQLMERQKLMMTTLSSMLKSMHDTKSQIIGNLR